MRTSPEVELKSMPSSVVLSPTGGLRVVEIDPQSDPRWTAFVNGHPDGSVFHHPAWLQALTDPQRGKPICLACVDTSGQFRGILPLMETRGFWFNLGPRTLRRRLSSLPRTPYAGPLVNDSRASAILLRAAMERVSRAPGFTLEIKVPSNDLDGMLEGVVRLPWNENYVLRIPEEPAALRFGNSLTRHRIKWAVNKAANLGVRVRRAETEEDLRAWYDLYLGTMRWHGAIPRPYRFFVRLWEILRPCGLLRLLVAEHGQGSARRMLAGYILLMFGRTVHCYVNGRRAEDLGLHPNDIIQWQAIHDASREGYRFYNFLDVPEGQAGLAEYKQKWGAQPIRSCRYYYPAIQVPHASALALPACLRAALKAAWRRMPLKATELLSEHVHRYL